jgi:hypothetical protein
MKKIIIFVSLLLLLASCWKSADSVVNTATGTNGSSTSGSVVEDEWNVKDPEITASWATGPSVKKTTFGSWHTGSVSRNASGKTEDEVVKDFEKDIDNLLNTIDKDGTKK